jgi:hypothetical protein
MLRKSPHLVGTLKVKAACENIGEKLIHALHPARYKPAVCAFGGMHLQFSRALELRESFAAVEGMLREHKSLRAPKKYEPGP